MLDTIRDAPLGQFLRLVTRNRILLYPEEREGFVLPKLASGAPIKVVVRESNSIDPEAADADADASDPEKEADAGDDEEEPRNGLPDFQKAQEAGAPSLPPAMTRNETPHLSPIHSHQPRPSWVENRLEHGNQLELEKTRSKPISLTKSADGTILVDWYTTDDPENPQNWSQGKKTGILLQICLYAFAMYGGSSIYVASEGGVMERFGVSEAAAALGLSLYVVGYGVGPLLFGPLSEIPAIGRNGVYTPAFTLFIIICVPTAVVDNFGSLLGLRFLQGFLCSPCLATGAGSIADLVPISMFAAYMSSWTAACFWGPAIGPVISSFAVSAEGWRWSLWELLWLSAPIYVLYMTTYPETSASNILRRRAQRLRKLTGRTDLRSQSEIDQEHMKVMAVFQDAIIKPLEIMIKDPAVAYTNFYTALLYGIYYSFFESFPLVYLDIYGFNLGELGLTFLNCGIGCLIGLIIYLLYLSLYLGPDIMKHGMREPEHRLIPALFGVWTSPAGLFMFGWTARRSVHWFASLVGIGIMVASNFVVLQCIYVYLPLSYPRYTASLMASNNLLRALFAAGAVEYSTPMFRTLGIGPGMSLLAGLALVGVAGMYVLWIYGSRLRAKSRFATA